MKNFSFLSLLTALVFVFGCTNQHHENANNESADGGRGIASVGKKKRKPVKIVRKGFYIKHSSMRRLPYHMKQSYYEIFSQATFDYIKIRDYRRRRGAENKFELNDFLELITPKAYAAVCRNALRAFDYKEKASCPHNESFVDFRKHPDWETKGPVGGLKASAERCSAEEVPCPETGLVLMGGEAHVFCVSNKVVRRGEDGPSKLCKKHFDNGGYRTAIALRDECKDLGDSNKPASASNIRCGDLRKSQENYSGLFKENCKNNRGVCKDMKVGVDAIENGIKEADDPSRKISQLPASESCNFVEENNLRDGTNQTVEADPHWKKLLELAAHCPSGTKPHKMGVQQAARLFGKCKVPSNIPSPEGYSLDNLISLYEKNLRAAESGSVNEEYVLQFAEQFGMIPTAFRDMFCRKDSEMKDIFDFANNVKKTLPDKIFKSRASISRGVTLNHRKTIPSFLANIGPKKSDPAKMREESIRQNQSDAFIALRQFLLTNEEAHEKLIAKYNNIDDPRESEEKVGATELARAEELTKAWVDKWEGQGPEYFVGRFNQHVKDNNITGTSLLTMRAAFSSTLRRLLLGQYNSRLDASEQWMKSCMDHTNENSAIAKITGDDEFVRENEFGPRGDQCVYSNDKSVSAYLAMSNPKPATVLKGDECYEFQKGYPKLNLKTLTYEVALVHPINKADRTKPFPMTEAYFSSPGKKNATYSLFTSSGCDRDVADAEAEKARTATPKGVTF